MKVKKSGVREAKLNRVGETIASDKNREGLWHGRVWSVGQGSWEDRRNFGGGETIEKSCWTISDAKIKSEKRPDRQLHSQGLDL